MPKQKRKWPKFHKIKLHNNRWMIWAVIVMALSASMLLAYIEIVKTQFVEDVNYLKQVKNWRAYKDGADNYEFLYPRNWVLEFESSDNVFSLVNPDDVNEYFTITRYDVAEEKELKQAIATVNEKTINLNGVNATQIVPDKRLSENLVLIKQGKFLYTLQAKGRDGNRILSMFKFSTPLISN